MTIAVFVGELLLLVAGTDIFGTRNLAVAWVGMPLLIGALLAAAGRTTGVIALVLILAGFGINNIRLLDPARTAIPYSTAADWIEQREDRGGVILDGSIISPSPLSPLDGYLSTELPEYRLTNIEDRPDFIERMYEPYDAQAVVDQAFSGQGPVHVVLHGQVPRQLGTGRSYGFFAQDQPVRLPRGWTATEEVDLPGLEDLHISTFTRKAEADE
jgi:hypothetical protein